MINGVCVHVCVGGRGRGDQVKIQEVSLLGIGNLKTCSMNCAIYSTIVGRQVISASRYVQ